MKNRKEKRDGEQKKEVLCWKLHKQKVVDQPPVVARGFSYQAFFYLTFPTSYIHKWDFVQTYIRPSN